MSWELCVRYVIASGAKQSPTPGIEIASPHFLLFRSIFPAAFFSPYAARVYRLPNIRCFVAILLDSERWLFYHACGVAAR